MITRRMLLLMSLLFIVTVFIVPTYGNDGIDYGICDPLNFTIKPPPPPALSESYQTKIEWKWINTGTTVDVIDTYNGITSSGSVDMFIEGQETKMLFDYKENQVVTYTKNDKGCTVRGLGTLELYQGKMWLTSLHSLYSVFKSADVAYMGETVVRATNTSWFQTCLYLYQFNITAQMNIYFSAYGWGMAFSRPDETIPVRIEIIASQSLKPFHVVGDLTEFNPSPIVDETIMQVPPGTFCDGRLSRRPLNLFPESFSLVFERVDLDFSKITYEKIWFDSKKKLIRRDYKEASGNDPDPSSEIFDFNLGIQYTIDSYMGTCDPVRALDPGDLFVVSNKNGTLRMMTSPEYFHAQNTDVQYIGSRETRGVECDVWVGKYLDDEANMNFTIEWYFTKDHWVEAVGGVIQPASLYRMDIWQGRNARPIIRNVLQFNSEAPPQEVFDITPCFPWTGKARLLVHFAVLQGQISSVSNMYLKDLLHTTLVSKAFLPPLRISKVSVQLLGETDLYLDGILLDSAPIVNPRIVPPPPPRHSLTASLEFLNGAIEGKWQLFVNSTIGNTQVVLESRGLIKIDYRSEFTTTPVTTMSTTTEATPKLITPSTAKSTKYETPPSLPTVTNKPCECPPPPTCPTTKVVIPTSSCPKVQCPSPPIQQGCTTQRTSCPPCTAVSCPACSTPAPCPTVIQTTPKPCPPLKFRSCPPVVPTAKTCPPVQQTPCPTGAAVPGVAGANKQSSKSGGVSSGTVAGVAMIMLVVGCIFGVILLIAYKKIRGSVAPDRRNILDKYLDDDNKY